MILHFSTCFDYRVLSHLEGFAECLSEKGIKCLEILQ